MDAPTDETPLERRRRQLREAQRRLVARKKGDPAQWLLFIRRTMLSAAKIRARKKGVPFSITLDDIQIPEVCPVLKIHLNPFPKGGGQATDNSPSLDRVVPEQGYTRGNVVVISQRANTIKGFSTPAELRRVADWVEEISATR